jgi:hypothetical protein
VERFFRLGLNAGDAFEREVRTRLGADKAKLVRNHHFQVVWSEGCR